MSVEAVRTTGTSADVMHDLFALHLGPIDRPLTALDLTWGKGSFWRRWLDLWAVRLTRNDLHVSDAEYHHDFKRTPWPERSFDVVVFDPPFTANGPSRDGRQKRYGSDRSVAGAPQRAQAVRDMLEAGLREAMRLARYALIVKTQDVTESQRVWWNADAACRMLEADRPPFARYDEAAGGKRVKLTGYWQVEDKVWLRSARAPQPDRERGTAPQRMRNRPSVFIYAVRKGEKR